MIALVVALGAAVGAPLRYLVDRAVQSRHRSVVPWGTLTVNVTASFVLGVVVGSAPSATLTALIGTGFCGALSTYSTFSYETLQLGRSGPRPWAAVNVMLSLLAGLAAAALGWWIGAQ